MKISLVETKQLCHGCRMMKPAKSFAFAYNGKLYCSKGCQAKAMWLIIPIPRSAA